MRTIESIQTENELLEDERDLFSDIEEQYITESDYIRKVLSNDQTSFISSLVSYFTL